MGDERLEMVTDFVTESRDMLNDIEPQITQLEKYAMESGNVNDEILNTIFRLFHSIKGMASFLDLRTVMTVTHEAETLLDLVRKGQLTLHSEHVDVLYRTSDFVRGLLDVIDRQLNDAGFEQTATTIIDEIHKTIGDSSEENDDEKERISLTEIHKVSGESHFVVNWKIVEGFMEESLEILEEAEFNLLQLKVQQGGEELLEDIGRCFNWFNEKSGLYGYSDLEHVSHLTEHIVGYYRDSGYKPQDTVINVLLTVVEHLKKSIASLKEGGDGSLPQGRQLLSLLEMLLKVQEVDGDNDRISETEANSDSRKEEEKEGVFVSRDTLRHTVDIVRVSVDKLDLMVDLADKLAAAEGIVAQGGYTEQNQTVFYEALLEMKKLTREIQNTAIAMRMIPLSTTFRKMLRLVRDLALKKHRQVNLEIRGEDTEVDKSVIEQLSDPLVHLLRNAVDHGLENPQERLACGKPQVGQIILEAKYSEGELWVSVRDDGRGLVREKILAKARQKGLLQEGKTELSDEEVWQLIFEPGLSTAEEITYISGRGVGMDVVKRNVEKMGGRIAIYSEVGKGSCFTLRVPATVIPSQ